MNRRFSPPFAAACLGILLFGITLTTTGSILPAVIDRFGLEKAVAGSLLSLMSVGLLVSSVVFGPIVDRYGTKGLMLAGAVGALLALEAIAAAPSPRWLAPAVFLIGLSGGLINGVANALVADISIGSKGSDLALMGVFFGVGALAVPVILGLLLDELGYQRILAGIGATLVVPIGVFVAVRFPPPKQAQGFPLRKAGALLGETTLLLMGLMLFFQSGIEVTVGGWSAQFVKEILGLSEGRSVLVLSSFWIGMMLARLALTPLLKRTSPAKVLLAFLGMAAVGAILLLSARGVVQAVAGLTLLGFGMAAGFPVILGYVGEQYPELTGTAFSIAFVLALIGATVLPAWAGVLGQWYGLRRSLLIVPAGALAMGLIFIPVLRRLAARKPAPHHISEGT